MIKRTAVIALSMLASLAAGLVSPAAAADFPTRPITLLAPFAAGGTVDIVARIVGLRLGQELGQSVIVENRGGAGGTIGAGMLARAAPDGHTLMITHQGLAFNVALYDKLPYDTVKDIMPLANIGMTPNVLVVTNSLPVKTLDDFLGYAKTKPVNYGSGGHGSAGHLPMEVLQSMTGAKLQHVPYKGSGPALNDLMSGQIQAMLLTIPAVMPHIQGNRVRAIATSGQKRTPALPNLPTMDEAGIKGFDYSPWYGFFAPAGTPPDVVQKLHTAINKVLTDPEIVSKLGLQGLEVQAMPREQFGQIVTSDIAKWGKIIKKLDIKVN
ncbi:MAG: tripartite tricarboxylate transporter substrate binding protein [Polaromonas sp.]|nr:tripartite tricarboxylate transporter substrate binding protein [Polaromonas sp.]